MMHRSIIGNIPEDRSVKGEPTESPGSSSDEEDGGPGDSSTQHLSVRAVDSVDSVQLVFLIKFYVSHHWGGDKG